MPCFQTIQNENLTLVCDIGQWMNHIIIELDDDLRIQQRPQQIFGDDLNVGNIDLKPPIRFSWSMRRRTVDRAAL